MNSKQLDDSQRISTSRSEPMSGRCRQRQCPRDRGHTLLRRGTRAHPGSAPGGASRAAPSGRSPIRRGPPGRPRGEGKGCRARAGSTAPAASRFAASGARAGSSRSARTGQGFAPRPPASSLPGEKAAARGAPGERRKPVQGDGDAAVRRGLPKSRARVSRKESQQPLEGN